MTPAALSVKVTARICDGSKAPAKTWFAIRRVIVVVFPEPAPARMQTGPRTASTAARCCGFSPSKTSTHRAYAPDRNASVPKSGILRAMSQRFVVRALVAWGVNVVILIVIDWLFDSVAIGRWGPLLIGAAVFGLANAIVKPVLAILTFPLIIITLGLSYFALNMLMLALAEWIAPDFTIDGFWTYVGAAIVAWLVNWVLQALLDR